MVLLPGSESTLTEIIFVPLYSSRTIESQTTCVSRVDLEDTDSVSERQSPNVIPYSAFTPVVNPVLPGATGFYSAQAFQDNAVHMVLPCQVYNPAGKLFHIVFLDPGQFMIKRRQLLIRTGFPLLIADAAENGVYRTPFPVEGIKGPEGHLSFEINHRADDPVVDAKVYTKHCPVFQRGVREAGTAIAQREDKVKLMVLIHKGRIHYFGSRSQGFGQVFPVAAGNPDFDPVSGIADEYLDKDTVFLLLENFLFV